MLQWIHNMVGLPLLVVLVLLVVAVIWYMLGQKMASAAAAIGLVLIAVRQSRENALLRDRAKGDKVDRDAIAKANQARLKSRHDNLAGGLRDDDGFKRD